MGLRFSTSACMCWRTNMRHTADLRDPAGFGPALLNEAARDSLQGGFLAHCGATAEFFKTQSRGQQKRILTAHER